MPTPCALKGPPMGMQLVQTQTRPDAQHALLLLRSIEHCCWCVMYRKPDVVALPMRSKELCMWWTDQMTSDMRHRCLLLGHADALTICSCTSVGWTKLKSSLQSSSFTVCNPCPG